MPLSSFNRLAGEDARAVLEACLPVPRWVDTIIDARPFPHLDDLLEVARDAAFPFTPAELEVALARCDGPLPVRPPNGKDPPGAARVRRQLEVGVRTYQRRFARPFVTSASGQAPTQILMHLWHRLGHDVDTEDRVLAQQLRQIALIKLTNAVSTPERSGVGVDPTLGWG